MRIKTFLVGLFSMLLFVFQAQAATITDIRTSNYRPGVVRTVVELSEKPDLSVFKLSAPTRLVVDFKHTSLATAVRQKTGLQKDFLTGVRFGAPAASTTRIVLDLANDAVTETHQMLAPQGGSPWRFVIDLTGSGKATPSTLKATTPTSTSGLKPFKPAQKRKKVIMLDPGHGGQDPGAISKAGRYEKDLTLKMAKETKELLEDAGYKVVLSRSTDVYITLRGRVKKAHEAGVDLFMSIHADSAANSSARGLSVYTISEHASDKEAAALAERENKADILFGMDLGDYQPEVGNILIDLAKRDTMDKSAAYAQALVTEMKQTVQLVPNAHRFAGFAVLKSPNIPSVLIELGYLSNRSEERAMQKQSYRKKLGKAIVRAVDNYFKNVDTE